ncbi:hypothetical protein EASAB2608_06706 [Streptomyces sp. EAS-AB2608]|uniref:Uncharacterized protein n=1 Tax=Streptomyces bangladeshensis TaxID=295352 RepID=A0ABN3BL22_9ACTN|nr:hypothetical protein EASAB2608_06706 [Streptomyces sp. EAS-AB2608]
MVRPEVVITWVSVTVECRGVGVPGHGCMRFRHGGWFFVAYGLRRTDVPRLSLRGARLS